MFVLLDMELEETVERLSKRQNGDENSIEMMKVALRIHFSLHLIHLPLFRLCIGGVNLLEKARKMLSL